MDWLKELLEKATITDGKLDVVALMELVKVEFPKHAVPKKDYNDKVTELKTAAENIKKEYALKEKLTAAGVLDADYIIYKRGGLDKFTFDKDGAPVGVDDVIKPLKESSPHLFKAAEQPPAGGKKSGYTPKAGQTDEGSPCKIGCRILKQGRSGHRQPLRKSVGMIKEREE